MYTANAIRNVVLLGHSGSGKSALAESLLYMTGAIDRMGKNADGNTVCDYDPEEIRRNISIATSVVPLEYKNTKTPHCPSPVNAHFVRFFRLDKFSCVFYAQKTGVRPVHTVELFILIFQKWPNFLFFRHNFSLFCKFHKIMIEILFSFMYNVNITVHTRI